MRGWIQAAAAVVLTAATAHAESLAGANRTPNSIGLRASIVERSPSGSETRTTAGYGFSNGFRAEIERFISRASLDPAAGVLTTPGFATGTTLLSGLFEFRDDGWRTKPYIGAGFGLADVRQNAISTAGSAWATAYQVKGGLTLGFSQKLIGSLEYRWTLGQKPHFALGGIPAKIEINRHSFSVGVNYHF